MIINPVKILIVDDNQDSIDILKYKLQLSKTEYLITESNSGQDALNKIDIQEPDIVLLDIMMPGMDGFEVTQKIKMKYADSFVPVIMITAREDLNSKIKGFESGGDDYITKPFEIAELEARIRSLLRIRELQDKVNRMNEQIVQAETLSAVVATVATLNHEINNPLCAILLDIQMLKLIPEVTSGPETVIKKIDKIETSAKRIAEITKKLSELDEITTKDYIEGQKIIDLNK